MQYLGGELRPETKTINPHTINTLVDAGKRFKEVLRRGQVSKEVFRGGSTGKAGGQTGKRGQVFARIPESPSAAT